LINAHGGVLLVGVADDGEIVGIEKDIQILPKRQDVDEYENHLTTLLENGLGAAAVTNVGARFEEVNGHTVCRITVRPSSSPVWTKLKGQEDALYVRLGNSTRPFGPRDAHEYISHHFR
jgi:ATP-dependent Lon protease